MTRAERFSALARRWFYRDETGLTADRFMEAIEKRATEEAAHILQSEAGSDLDFLAYLIPFSDGSFAAMFVRDGRAPVIADIEPEQFNPAVQYAANLSNKLANARQERAGATVH